MLTTDVTKVEYSMAGADLPFDPLSQRRGSATPLWVDRAGVVVQGRPEPPTELRRAIAAMAQSTDDLGALWERAERLASTLGPSRSDDIAAAFVHPPTDREWLETLPDGLFRYQIATAFVLAALPNAWSTTRPIFESILFGPVDWCSGAAIVALGELVRRDARHAREALELLSDVVDDLLPHSCEPRFLPLGQLLWGLPCVPRSTMETLAAWHREQFVESDEATPEDDPAPAETAAPQSTAAKGAWLMLALIAAIVLVALLVK